MSAAKHARREGDFILDNLGSKIKSELNVHVDGIATKDKRFRKLIETLKRFRNKGFLMVSPGFEPDLPLRGGRSIQRATKTNYYFNLTVIL